MNMPALQKQFGRHLKRLRRDRQMTQAQLAKALDLSTSYVSNLERGVNSPSFVTVEKLARVLSVKVKDLFSFDM